MKTTAAIVVLICFLSAGGSAQRKFDVYGHGALSCGQWVTRQKEGRSDTVVTWVVAFVSGAGYTAPYTLKKTDADAMTVWIDNYCSANPLDSISNASGRLVDALRLK